MTVLLLSNANTVFSVTLPSTHFSFMGKLKQTRTNKGSRDSSEMEYLGTNLAEVDT
jgi:hypothetical protein